MTYEPTYKSVNCTTCYYNSIVGQMYIDSVPVPFCPLTDVVCYRPSSVSSTQLEVQAHVDDRVLSCQWLPSSGLVAKGLER